MAIKKFNEKKFQKLIVDVLQSKNLYEKTDDYLIDELIQQFQLLRIAQEDVSVRGINVNVRKSKDEEPFYNLNQSVAVINQCVKQIQSLYTKLGITPQERSKLKLIEKKNDFDLGKFLNNN